MEISLHIFEYHVDVLIVFCSVYLVQLHYVLVVEQLQKHDLPVGPLSVCGMLKCIEDLLQSEYFLRFPIPHPPDVSIGPTANFFEYLKPFKNVLLNILCHIGYNNSLAEQLTATPNNSLLRFTL